MAKKSNSTSKAAPSKKVKSRGKATKKARRIGFPRPCHAKGGCQRQCTDFEGNGAFCSNCGHISGVHYYDDPIAMRK